MVSYWSQLESFDDLDDAKKDIIMGLYPNYIGTHQYPNEAVMQTSDNATDENVDTVKHMNELKEKGILIEPKGPRDVTSLNEDFVNEFEDELDKERISSEEVDKLSKDGKEKIDGLSEEDIKKWKNGELDDEDDE